MAYLFMPDQLYGSIPPALPLCIVYSNSNISIKLKIYHIIYVCLFSLGQAVGQTPSRNRRGAAFFSNSMTGIDSKSHRRCPCALLVFSIKVQAGGFIGIVTSISLFTNSLLLTHFTPPPSFAVFSPCLLQKLKSLSISFLLKTLNSHLCHSFRYLTSRFHSYRLTIP